MFDLKIYEEKMEKALDVLKREYSGLRTGRASISLLDPIFVDAYGSKTPLNQVSNVEIQMHLSNSRESRVRGYIPCHGGKYFSDNHGKSLHLNASIFCSFRR